LKEFVVLVILGNVIAWPTVYFLMRFWLQTFAYQIDLDLGIFAISGFLILLIAIITVSSQAIKAARANPVDALQYE